MRVLYKSEGRSVHWRRASARLSSLHASPTGLEMKTTRTAKGETTMIAMTREETAAYLRDGYILRSGLLSREEVGRFRDTARAQLERENREGAVMSKGDKDGKTTLLKMWTKAEDDQYGLLARTSGSSISRR